MLQRLLAATQLFQDPLLFAYTPNRNTEDAILTVTHAVLKHPERPKASARVILLDFSSAFNTIQPHLLMQKLMVMDTNPVIIRWLCILLTDRPQRVVVRSSTTLEVSSESAPTLEPLKDVCSPLRCSRCTHPTAGVLPKTHFRLSSRTTSR